MRTLGFLTGSVAVALVWLFLDHQAGGLPAPTLARNGYAGTPPPDVEHALAAEKSAPAGDEPTSASVPGAEPPTNAQPDTTATEAMAAPVEPAVDPEEAAEAPIPAQYPSPPMPPPEPEGSPGDTVEAIAEPPGASVLAANETEGRWEAFFTPFRSQASAEGFARFLQTATGREFRVRRAGPGEYRVWFSMDEGESRPQRLAEIETVTGMALSGGEL